MSTLFLDRIDLEVRLADGALALYENGTRTQTIPLRLLERVVIQGARTRLDSQVIIKLAELGIATLFLSPRAGRQAALLLGPQHNDAAVRLAQAHRVTDEAFCASWATQKVRAKLRRQHRFLERAEHQRPDQRKALFDARNGIEQALRQLEADQGGTATPRLRGLEGSGARAYFGGYTTLFAPQLNFSGRNRRPPRDPVNACLSLGYTLLHFDAVRAAHGAGLDPLLGFYHRPSFGRESLACDLIEPLRPAVDEWLWQQFAAGPLRPEHFTQDKGACLLGKAGRNHFYAQWERFAPGPRRWLRQSCAQLARTLRTEGMPLIGQELDDEAF